LNHYYFISVVAFILIFLPANRFFALDARFSSKKSTKVPAWTINILKLQLAIVYFYAGLAKLNADWLLEALPLKIWLPSKVHLPLIGELLSYNATAYLFSWAGAIFDLTIIAFLIYNRTRVLAYLALVIFHLMTWYLFPIGMFPFVMISGTIIFFSENAHKKFYALFKVKTSELAQVKLYSPPKIVLISMFIFISFQILFPFRCVLYPGDLFWTEQGYRFSWRVMLMEKAGYATFTIVDDNGKKETVDNALYLSPFQEKMMSTQADFILQYSNYLSEVYRNKGFVEAKVYADVFVTLNGSGSKRFIDPNVNLAGLKDSFAPKKFILAY
jgi:hypothetical protein